MAWARTAALMLALMGPTFLSAQQFPVFQEQLPVASINREVLFAESAYGRALLAQLAARRAALVTENDQLLANLEREERELTELRKEITPQEFSPLAEAFDLKANRIRKEQAQKLVDLSKRLEEARFIFFRNTETVIKNLMVEHGIIYVLNEQAILISTGEGNITPDVMARLDALFASGELLVADE